MMMEWILGIYERRTEKIFLTPVQSRRAEHLMPVVYDKIPAGSIVFTDELSTYKRIDEWCYHLSVMKLNNMVLSTFNGRHFLNIARFASTSLEKVNYKGENDLQGINLSP